MLNHLPATLRIKVGKELQKCKPLLEDLEKNLNKNLLFDFIVLFLFTYFQTYMTVVFVQDFQLMHKYSLSYAYLMIR